MSYALSEIERMLANLIRIGTIDQIDLQNAKVKVRLGTIVTDWLSWKERRAGSTKTWSPPSQGEQVLVLSPFGDTSQAVVLTGFFSDNNLPPSSDGNTEKTTFSDGSTVEYNSESNTMTVAIAGAGKVVTNCKTVDVNAETSVTIDTPSATFTGNVQVDGNLNSDGNLTNKGVNTGSTHGHSGVKSGPDISGPPTP